MVKISRYVSHLMVLALLVSCEPTASETPGTQPSPEVSSSTGASTPSVSAPAFHGYYTMASQPYVFERGGYLNQQQDNGDIYLLGSALMRPRSGGETTTAALLHQLNAQGEPMWSKGFATGQDLRFADLKVYNNAMYIAGGYRDTSTPPPDRDKNISIRDLVVMKLDLTGKVLWKQRFKVPPFTQNVQNEFKVLPLDAQRVGVNYFNRLYVLDTTTGEYLQGLDFQGPIQSVLATADGGFWVNHRVVPPGYTWVNSGFQISALDAQLKPRWQKAYGEDLKGLFTLANLGEASPGRYHTAMAINEANSFSNSVGIVHFFLNDAGEIERSFADMNRVEGRDLMYAAIHDSRWQGGQLYLSTEHTNGKRGIVLTATTQYAPDGTIVHMRKTPLRSTGVYQNRLLLSLSGQRGPSALHFELAANAFQEDLCTETPLASIEREDYTVTVTDSPLVPQALQAPQALDFPEMPELEVGLRKTQGQCTGL